jgi:hypothetical protein
MPDATGRDMPSRLAEWMQPFRDAFTAPTWQRVMVLVMGASLFQGRRTGAIRSGQNCIGMGRRVQSTVR